MANLLLLKKFWCFFYTYIYMYFCVFCLLFPLSIPLRKHFFFSVFLFLFFSVLFECHTIPFQIYLFNIWQIDKVIHSAAIYLLCVDALGCAFFLLFIFLLYFGWSFGWCWESTSMEADTHYLHTQAMNPTSNNTRHNTT